MQHADTESYVRALIAVVVIGITWALTHNNADVAAQWEAVFLMVIAYYFKDRPQADNIQSTSDETQIRPVRVELYTQFAIAMLLLVFTTELFVTYIDNNETKSADAAVTNVAESPAAETTATVSTAQQPTATSRTAAGGRSGTAAPRSTKSRAQTISAILRESVKGAWIGGVTLAIAFYFKDLKKSAATHLHESLRSVLAASVALATLLIVVIRLIRDPHNKAALPIQWVALAFIVFGFYFKERAAGDNDASPRTPRKPRKPRPTRQPQQPPQEPK